MAGVTKYKIGDIFGNKEIIEYCGSDPVHRVSLWKFKCLLCGEVRGPVRTGTLTRKDRSDSVPRCCYDSNRIKGSENPAWKGYKEITGSWLHQYRYDAKKKNREWSVTPEYLWQIWESQQGKCRYTNIELRHGETASLDRIDSSKGYIEGNVQWVHRMINRMKSDLSENEFLDWCRKVSAGS